MAELNLGVLAASRKENESRLPLHPAHIERIDPDLRASLFLEEGYGARFDTGTEDLKRLVGGTLARDALLERCDVVLLPKPLPEDLLELREGQVLWGWPHCVQDAELTQNAIDRKLTLIAWEAMNLWKRDGSFALHVFHKNNELAGYASVMHALRLRGLSGNYGRKLRAAVIGFGSTGRGAVAALNGLGIFDVTVLTQRDPTAVAAPMHSVTIAQYDPDEDDPGELSVTIETETVPLVGLLADHDVVVNCVLQDPEAPTMFVMNEHLKAFSPGSVIVDVSCDEGMGFEWARPTTFTNPLFTVGDGIHYYAVDHSPSYLWDSATWEISEALLPYLGPVMGGPTTWESEPTISRAIEIRDGVVQNPTILSFQNRAPDYPHARL